MSVSMKSGLEGRNNIEKTTLRAWYKKVSMKSGLEGRNNTVYPKYYIGKDGKSQ